MLRNKSDEMGIACPPIPYRPPFRRQGAMAARRTRSLLANNIGLKSPPRPKSSTKFRDCDKIRTEGDAQQAFRHLAVLHINPLCERSDIQISTRLELHCPADDVITLPGNTRYDYVHIHSYVMINICKDSN